MFSIIESGNCQKINSHFQTFNHIIIFNKILKIQGRKKTTDNQNEK